MHKREVRHRDDLHYDRRHLDTLCHTGMGSQKFARPWAEGVFLSVALNAGGVPVQTTGDKYKFDLFTTSGALLENKVGYSPQYAGFPRLAGPGFYLTGIL